MFCPECGTDHHAGEREVQAVADREVEIARINAKRDIDVARIQARMQRDDLETAEAVAEIGAEAEVEVAVAEAEIVGAALEAGVVDSEPEPIVIDAPPPAEPEPDGDELPPAEGSPAPEPSGKRVGLGMW